MPRHGARADTEGGAGEGGMAAGWRALEGGKGMPHLWLASGSKIDASCRPGCCAAPTESACERRTQPSGGWRGGTGARRAQLGSRGRACGAIHARCVRLPGPGGRGGEGLDRSPGGGGGVGHRGGHRRSPKDDGKSPRMEPRSLSIGRASSKAISVVQQMRFVVPSTTYDGAPAPAPGPAAVGGPAPTQRNAACGRPSESRPRPSLGRRTMLPSRHWRRGPHCRARHAASAGGWKEWAGMRAGADCGKGRGLSRRGPICKVPRARTPVCDRATRRPRSSDRM